MSSSSGVPIASVTAFLVISLISTRWMFGLTGELLGDVPGDGLAFAIGVGRQQHALGPLGRALDLGEHLLLAVDDLVLGLEVVLDVDAHGLRGRSLT